MSPLILQANLVTTPFGEEARIFELCKSGGWSYFQPGNCLVRCAFVIFIYKGV